MAHFDLLRVYSRFWDPTSKGVPIVTTVEEYNARPNRSSVEEVFNKVVVPDLEYAIENCSGNNGEGYFNKWTAQLILARAYEYQNKNELALSTAQNLISNSPYNLWSYEDYASGFQTETSKQGATEALFQLLMTGTTDWNDNEGIAFLYYSKGYAVAHATYDFYMDIKTNYANDCRRELLVSKDFQTGKTTQEGYVPEPEISEGTGEDEKEGKYTDSTPIWINKYLV